MTSAALYKLTCLCGTISEPGTLLNSSIPAPSEICHCNSCRYTTGSLGGSFPSLKSSPSPQTLARLAAYKSSGIVTRYFCPTCGCHCFTQVMQSGKWSCLGGIIERGDPLDVTGETGSGGVNWPKDVVQVESHDYINDTVDGGISPFLLGLYGREIPTWKAGPRKETPTAFDLSHNEVLSLHKEAIKDLPAPEIGSYLPAKCHCGGVSLLIRRADYNPNEKKEKEARFIPSDPTKYQTYFCACRSCRLTTGVSLTSWTTLPPENVFNGSDPTVKPTPLVIGHAVSGNESTNPGLSLKHYWSSQNVCRSFCGTCGATVGYWNSERPTELDLSPGIFRAEEGIMARKWLEWEWGRCSFPEECVDESLLEAWKKSEYVMK